jgi:glucan 1,3-beta-glucosidase
MAKAVLLVVVLAVLALVFGQDNKKATVGTNIGGWLVLEPWITPSLFYRFLGKTQSDGVGVDSYTFCKALGPSEGNKVMRSHWDNWVTEEHIKGLADREVEVVRLPIGDWTLSPYGPYKGCMDGSEEKIQWFLDTAAKYKLKVLLDVHAVVDSQNGFDNSGKASDFEWTDSNNFKHWSIENATWMGHFDGDSQTYTSINQQNMQWSLDVVKNLMKKWGNHPAVHALEPVNEPWWNSDLPTLKDFYRSCRDAVRAVNPSVLFVFHDSFRSDADTWNDLFADDDMENVVIDTHKYLAWNEALSDIGSYCDVYGATMGSDAIQSIKYPIWVGEWSLATDVCALWLGGLNDSNMEYQFQCQSVECPTSYMPAPYGVDFDRTAPELGPYGETDRAIIRNGMCLTDSAYFSDADVKTLGDCTSYILNEEVAGQFLWNFRTELEPRWSYVEAYDAGWLNNYSQGYSYSVKNKQTKVLAAHH